MKKKIRLILASVLFYSGLLDCWSKFFLKNKAVILMYHRVLQKNKSSAFPMQPGMYVTEKNFYSQISFLQSRFKIVALPELVKMLQRNENISRCCCLTFDDGWLDNYKFAFPILKKFNAPATIFLATGYIDTEDWFWPDEMSYYLSELSFQKENLPELLDYMAQLNLNSTFKNDNAEFEIDSVIETSKRLSIHKRKKFIAYLKDKCLVNPKSRLLMNWNEVREMAETGLISFGSHTISHELLDKLPKEQQQKEIVYSQKKIENFLEQPVSCFAYPNGNYDKGTLAVLEKEQFVLALTTKRGYVGSDCDLLQAPRIAIHDDVSSSSPLFFYRILCR